MSTQIAVRLPDGLVDFVDGLVRDGKAPSRSAVITRALDRERRRAIAEDDVAILSAAPPDPDLEQLSEFAARTALDHLD